MKKNEVEIGCVYVVKVSNELCHVKVIGEHPHGGFIGLNLASGRKIRIKTAGRLREKVS